MKEVSYGRTERKKILMPSPDVQVLVMTHTIFKRLVKTDEKGNIHTQKSNSLDVDGLWLLGYSDWTGYAFATQGRNFRNSRFLRTCLCYSTFFKRSTSCSNNLIYLSM